MVLCYRRQLRLGRYLLDFVKQYPLFEADMAIQLFFYQVKRPPHLSFLLEQPLQPPVFGKCPLHQLMVVPQNGKDIGFLQMEMIGQLRLPEPIGIALDAFS